MQSEEIKEYRDWIQYLRDKPDRIKEAYIPKILREFEVPIQIIKKDLGFSDEEPAVKSFSKAVEDFIEYYDTPRIKLGYKEVDEFFGGFFPGQIVILGGRTKTGKTTVALNLMHQLVVNGVSTLFFSLEMSAARVLHRILKLASQKQITEQEIRRASSLGLLERIIANIPEEYFSNFYIYDKGAIPASELDVVLAETEEYAQKKIQAVFIDYFELVKVYSKDSLDQAIKASKIIADFAKRNKVLTVILHQCKRAAENAEIMLNHIKYAGEEDADLVLGIWRPNYDIESTSQVEELLIEMKVLKNRDGRETKFHLHVNTENLKIDKIERIGDGSNDQTASAVVFE